MLEKMSFDEFARRWPHFAGRYMDELSYIARQELAKNALKVAVKITPVGSSFRTKGSLSKSPGTAKRAWRIIKGSKKATGGAATRVVNSAAHARILNHPYERAPRRKKFPKKGGPIMKRGAVGSLRAPSGLVAPIEASVARTRDDIVRKAIRMVEAKVKV